MPLMDQDKKKKEGGNAFWLIVVMNVLVFIVALFLLLGLFFSISEACPIFRKGVCDDSKIKNAYSLASDFYTYKPRYGFSDREKILLAQLISGDYRKDGDGEYDIDFQTNPNLKEVYKVLCVVMNRQRHQKFHNKIEDILLARGQFSVFPRNLKGTPSKKTLKIVSDWCDKYDRYVINDVQIIPDDHVYFTGNGKVNKTRR